ncbi:AAA family ATPase [Sagittula sp. SSi028]|uniref:AAA family ATPase n=1 Tax=Sagittula sp. SSi028 TaxID=3400636 RepID=UPI003AF7589E
MFLNKVPTDTSVPVFCAYVCTDQGAALARDVLGALGVADSALRGGGLSGAARVSGDTPVAMRLLAELGNLPLDQACEAVADIRASGAEVIVLGQLDDLRTARALRRAGALDYFDYGSLPEDIADLCRFTPDTVRETTPEPVASVSAPVTSPVVGVIGCSGGAGASLLARNFAFAASKTHRAALVDADLRFGTQALDLDCPTTPGLAEALSAPERVDQTFLKATMHSLNDGLSLYAHPHGATEPSIATMPRLLPKLRENFEAVVVDLPREAILTQPDIARALDVVILVLPAGYGGINVASRLIPRLMQAAPDLRILPVLSELRKDAGLSHKEIAQALLVDIAGVLPRCDGAALAAHRAGRSIIDMQRRGAYARSVHALWKRVNGQVAPRNGLLKRVFS